MGRIQKLLYDIGRDGGGILLALRLEAGDLADDTADLAFEIADAGFERVLANDPLQGGGFERQRNVRNTILFDLAGMRNRLAISSFSSSM